MLPTPRASAPPAAALPDAYGQHGNRQPGHFPQVPRNGFRLAALLRIDTGVRAGGIEQGNDGPVELGRDLHHAQCLEVALRFRHPEIPV